MCGRYTLAKTVPEIEELVGDIEEDIPLGPRYNIAPTQPILAMLSGEPHRLQILQWGLIPHWAKDPTIGQRLINARAETIHEKPAFRTCFKSTRCLIFADGFYEWTQRPGEPRKTPMYIQLASKKVFAFAGLWSHWQSADGSELMTATIITTKPNPLIKPIHRRMPVILPPAVIPTWLDTATFKTDALRALLTPYPAQDMRMHAVTHRVNQVKHDDAACIAPLAGQPPRQPDLFDP